MARKGTRAAAGTPAIVALRGAGVAHVVHPYEVAAGAPTSYGEAVAAALGVAPTRMFKTLVATADGSLVVGVVPVATTLDLKALANALGAKRAAMAEPAAAERATGYVTGGISPLGQRTSLSTVVDVSAMQWETIFVSAGRRGLQVELAPAELVRLTGGQTAAIAVGS